MQNCSISVSGINLTEEHPVKNEYGICETENIIKTMEVNIMKELNKEQKQWLDEFTKNMKEFQKLWKLIEDKKGHIMDWNRWKTPYPFGIRSSLGDIDEVLRNKFVEYCDIDNEEDHPLGCFNTDYPLIFVANNLNGKIFGEWIAPHQHYDYPSFYTDVDCSTGEIWGLTTPLILCSINLPEDFEANRKLDSLYPNIWLYSRDLFEEEPEDRYAVSEYACGGIG